MEHQRCTSTAALRGAAAAGEEGKEERRRRETNEIDAVVLLAHREAQAPSLILSLLYIFTFHARDSRAAAAAAVQRFMGLYIARALRFGPISLCERILG